ncbi:OPT/YSL family transporter [Peptoniphilus equinus]|uniref:OPT/YSL family transporter n=1 Tax=Peptoniphilus equinus TaxID=3016343 RepID=A0ABY7QTS8_9FIRM|nr:OPT/YSL family transporter [Peptoniphilus equinus]WBW50177.1 OPT/YSL family transporter [Peptoniphilus equinus]
MEKTENKDVQKLSKDAYGGVAGKDYVPYVKSANRSGMNLAVILIGAIIAAIFAASTAYSGMKAGLTVAAGIPGSIIGSALVLTFAKSKGILGKDLVQGMASGGESVASGTIFVLPAVILIGAQYNYLEAIIVGIGGVLFGVGVSTLVYDYLIVEEHGNLMYPESMAISETLVASEGKGESLKFMLQGFGIGGLITVFTGSFLNKVNSVFSIVGEKFYKFHFTMEANPLLMGIGFIVGTEVSLMMFAGSVLANFAVVPLVGFFAEMATDSAVVWNDSATFINQMGADAISGNYVKYIGAGMMICGGIIGAIRLIPTIITSLKATMGAKAASSSKTSRSNLNMVLLAAGVVFGVVGAFMISSNPVMAILGIVITLLLSAVFVIVSAKLTGTIGTSNLPVSGMTIASVVVATLIFVIMGWTGNADNHALLMFSTFIVVAIAMAGGYFQSQKVAFVIGGDKDEMTKSFSLSGVIGVVITMGVILLLKDQLAITSSNPPFALPQANLMSTLTSGIFSGEIPWIMIIVGIVMALFFFFANLPIMTVAIGFYLPISTTSIILIGAILRYFIEKTTKDKELADAKVANGISLSSGLVAGGSIVGLIGIVLQVTGVVQPGEITGFAASNGAPLLMIAFMVIATYIAISATKKHS